MLHVTVTQGLYYIQNHKISCDSRTLQLGAELYGHDSIEADVEMVDVMLGLIENAYTLQGAHLDLGHVGLFRSLVKYAGLSKMKSMSYLIFIKEKHYLS